MSETCPASAKHYALLVGINFSGGQQLKGAVNDVEEMKKILGPPRTGLEIETLISSAHPSLPFRPLQDAASLPTFNNIVAAFRSIVARAVPGDFFYFHFSGHGTSIPQNITNELTRSLESVISLAEYKPDTANDDLALQVLDGDDGQDIRYLRGLELAGLLREVVDKGLVATIVIDSCHSGSAARSDSPRRFVPYDPEVDARHPTMALDMNLAVDQRAGMPRHRDATMTGWLISPQRYGLLAACGPTESSSELNVQGKYYGALTYYLLRFFHRLGRVGGRLHHVHAHVCARFGEGRTGQTPILNGNKRLGFFGPPLTQDYAVPIPIVLDVDILRLKAGEAHGVCVGDRFALVNKADYGTFTGTEERRETFKIVSVGPLVSVLEALGGPRSRRTSGMIATACTSLGVRNFPIHFNLNHLQRDQWERAVKERPSLAVTMDNLAPKSGFAFYVTMHNDGHYTIRDSSRYIVNKTDIDFDSLNDFLIVLEILEHLARFTMIKTLFNTNPPTSFINSFNVRLQGEGKTGQFHPRCLNDDALLCSHRECAVVVKHETRVVLSIENMGSSTIYAHVYDMTCSWEIDNLQTDYKVIPTKQGQTDKTWTKNIVMTVPSNMSECEDVIKVFITNQPTSFMSFELPELGETMSRKVAASRSDDVPSQQQQLWAAFNFRVLTSSLE